MKFCNFQRKKQYGNLTILDFFLLKHVKPCPHVKTYQGKHYFQLFSVDIRERLLLIGETWDSVIFEQN